MDTVKIFGKIAQIISNVWKFFAGVIITIVLFYGNFFDLRRPNISVEITEIDQNTSPDVNISTSAAFRATRQILGENLFLKIRGGKIEDIRQSLDAEEQDNDDKIAADQRLREITQSQASIDQNKDEISKLLGQGNAFSSIIADNIIGQDPMSPVSLSAAIAKREQNEKFKQKQIQDARAEISSFEEASKNLEAKIILTAAISNSGDGSTTLKPQALLRTDLGQNNYLDIPLTISDYDNGKAELKARSASVLRLESHPIKDMSPEDRQRFLDFFKNTSPTRLFIVDVSGKFFVSNIIPFAKGIYEQRIYDDLKAFATKNSQ